MNACHLIVISVIDVKKNNFENTKKFGKLLLRSIFVFFSKV